MAVVPRVAHQIAQGLGDRVERQTGDVRHPAGQRHHLRPAGDGEQGADLRGLHRLGALGIPVDVVVQPGLHPSVRLRPRVGGQRRFSHSAIVAHRLDSASDGDQRCTNARLQAQADDGGRRRTSTDGSVARAAACRKTRHRPTAPRGH